MWILFLRILDEQEKRDREAAEAVGETFAPPPVSPFRWRDWAAPFKENDRTIHKPMRENLTVGTDRNFLPKVT